MFPNRSTRGCGSRSRTGVFSRFATTAVHASLSRTTTGSRRESKGSWSISFAARFARRIRAPRDGDCLIRRRSRPVSSSTGPSAAVAVNHIGITLLGTSCTRRRLVASLCWSHRVSCCATLLFERVISRTTNGLCAQPPHPSDLWHSGGLLRYVCGWSAPLACTRRRCFG